MKILVCVAWPYAAGPRHLGHAVATFIPADIVARYHRMKGDEVLMVGGSDMHGTPTMVLADQEGVTPRAVAERYNEAFADLENVQLPFSSPETPHTYQSYMMQIRPGWSLTRTALMQTLLEAGIPTRRGVMAIHQEPYYRQRVPGVYLPVTERATAETVLLPIYATMTESEQEYVIEHTRAALSASRV